MPSTPGWHAIAVAARAALRYSRGDWTTPFMSCAFTATSLSCLSAHASSRSGTPLSGKLPLFAIYAGGVS